MDKWWFKSQLPPRWSRPSFDGLFLTVLCTIQPLSDESLAPLSRGANAFWGLRLVSPSVHDCIVPRVPQSQPVGARLHLSMSRSNTNPSSD